jgi:hypothetical protein
VPPESHERTQRTLGVYGLLALGVAATLAVVGIVLVSLLPNPGLENGADALTALAAIGSGAIGALAGWLARGASGPPAVIDVSADDGSPPA